MPEIALTEKYIQRFGSRVLKAGPDECWPWQHTMTQNGYGQMFVAGKMVSAHRIAYQIEFGPIPDGLQVDHRCHNRRCCNPSHLRTATNAQNQENRSRFPGVRGLCRARNGKWRGAVRRAGQTYYAGTFDTRDEAEQAVIELRRTLGFRSDGR